uniref:DNA polymerase I n=1 Tax=Sutterella sp. TaxID=1981025 RepID=UPI003FD8167F
TMKGKIGENLRAGLPFLDEAKALVTVKCDAALPGVASVADLQFRAADEAALSAFSARWEISRGSLARAEAPLAGKTAAPEAGALKTNAKVPAAVKRPAAPAPELPREAEKFDEAWANPDETPFTEIEDAEGLAALLTELNAERSEPVGIALLYDGAARHADLGGFGFALTPKDVFVAQSSAALSVAKILETLRPWFESDVPKIFHDGKSALHALLAQKVTVGGRVDDVMLMDYTLEAHLGHELAQIAARLLKRRLPSRDEVLGKGAKRSSWREVEPAATAALLAEEAAAIRAAGSVLHARLACEGRLESVYEEIERPLLPVLFRMENTGISLDAALLKTESTELGAQIEQLAADAEKAAGHPFNLSSPKQLAQILFVEQGIPVVKKTASGSPSTDEEVLTELALDYPLPKLILEHRRLTKLRSTYLDKLPTMVDRDGRIHTTFGQAVAVTGRLASSDPNLQNIPTRTPEGRRIREAFVPRTGWSIVDADYSQVELRIMAHLSQDEGLLSAFARGEDIHRSTASEVFNVPLDQVTPNERRMAKVINFGLIYGMSAFGLAQQMGLDRKVAQNYVDQYFHRFPGVKRYMEKTRALAAEQGYVETAFGRRLWVPDIRASRPMVRAAAERAAINAPMQGTAADIIKRAMIAVDAWLRGEGLESRLLLQVHDELVVETPPEEMERVKTKLPELMAGAATLSVPLIAEVGVGKNWGEAH